MDIGDTFLLCDVRVGTHLWVVVSLPGENPDSIVIAYLTTYDRLKTDDCIIGPNDHPWIRDKCCVVYEHSRCVPEPHLTMLVEKGLLELQETAHIDLIRKILTGAAATGAIPIKCKQILEEQNLIDE